MLHDVASRVLFWAIFPTFAILGILASFCAMVGPTQTRALHTNNQSRVQYPNMYVLIVFATIVDKMK